jgi:hypothetical protein
MPWQTEPRAAFMRGDQQHRSITASNRTSKIQRRFADKLSDRSIAHEHSLFMQLKILVDVNRG